MIILSLTVSLLQICALVFGLVLIFDFIDSWAWDSVYGKGDRKRFVEATKKMVKEMNKYNT